LPSFRPSDPRREFANSIGVGFGPKLGFAGGSRRGALTTLLGRGKLRDLGPDPGPAHEWVDRVLDQFDPNDPEVPL
jgi:hypothetical protein